jgi:predicted outer membrane protein
MVAQPSFVSYYVVETDDNRLATVRVFDDLATLEAANQATHATQDAIAQEFTITTSEDQSFSGEVNASA